MLNQNVLVSYLDTSIDEMTTYVIHGRAKAMEFAKGKKFVSLTTI